MRRRAGEMWAQARTGSVRGSQAEPVHRMIRDTTNQTKPNQTKPNLSPLGALAGG